MNSTKIVRFPVPSRNRRGDDAVAREVNEMRDELRIVRALLQRVLRALPPAPFGFEEESDE